MAGTLRRICDLAVRELGVSGAGVTVMASLAGGLAGHRDQLYATGELARLLEDLQLTAGEGPCLDAFRGGVPVLVADLAAESTRWLGFGPDALAGGAAAVFSLPLQVGAVRLGTMDLYRDVPGGLTDDELADAWNLAGLATEVLLEVARAATTGPGPQEPTASGLARRPIREDSRAQDGCPTSTRACIRPPGWSRPANTSASARHCCVSGPTPSRTASRSPRSHS